MKDMHAQYRSLGQAEREALMAKGMRGTLAHRAGGFSFGKSRKLMQLQQAKAVSQTVAAILDRDDSHASPTHGDAPSAEADAASSFAVAPWERRAIRAELRIGACQAAEHFESQRAAMQAWSSSELAKVAGDLPTAAGSVGCCLSPCSVPGIDHMLWLPPASSMAKLALSGWAGPLRKSLGESWGKLHDVPPPAKIPSLGRVMHPKRSLCLQAGFCLHGRRGARIRNAVASFQGFMREALQHSKPPSAQRDVYNRNALVACFMQPGLDKAWYHVGHGNLNTHNFELLRLSAAPPNTVAFRVAEARGWVALTALEHADAQCGAACLWRSFRDRLDLELPCRVHLYRLVVSDDLIDGEFAPRDVLVSELAGMGAYFWAGSSLRPAASRATAPRPPSQPLPLEDVQGGGGCGELGSDGGSESDGEPE